MNIPQFATYSGAITTAALYDLCSILLQSYYVSLWAGV